MSISDDICKKMLIKNGRIADKFDLLYFSSNEEVKSLCSNFDLRDKNVLSV